MLSSAAGACRSTQGERAKLPGTRTEVHDPYPSTTLTSGQRPRAEAMTLSQPFAR